MKAKSELFLARLAKSMQEELLNYFSGNFSQLEVSQK